MTALAISWTSIPSAPVALVIIRQDGRYTLAWRDYDQRLIGIRDTISERVVTAWTDDAMSRHMHVEQLSA